DAIGRVSLERKARNARRLWRRTHRAVAADIDVAIVLEVWMEGDAVRDAVPLKDGVERRAFFAIDKPDDASGAGPRFGLKDREQRIAARFMLDTDDVRQRDFWIAP